MPTITPEISYRATPTAGTSQQGSIPPNIPDHELLRIIGHGSCGAVWLARNVLGQDRAVKIVYRDNFENDRPFEREFTGIQRFEPLSRSHAS
ncbi:MAG: hypothetical protein FJ403_15785 [Verrucomicrobia bacterium]|nr:hypothetical protein [Verrucomicrobiota bacterium]